jgi:alpha-N-arabinofuranosidase
MSASAHINIDRDRVIGERNPLIFGHFIEHFHRQIYGGVYDPGSALSDKNGFRTDVIEALKHIKVPVVRWPGGCFASGYHWKDGVGKSRKPFYDLAWRVEEPNTFGTDEFIAWCREVGAEPFICANAGTGTPEEMAQWVEYCNLPDGSPWARERIKNGAKKPHNVRYWSIGNENYGEWEIGGHKSAEWGHYVFEAAKMMKRVDPSIEITAAAYFLDFDWIRHLLEEAGQVLDWISVHCYWAQSDTSYESCMARSGTPESILTGLEHQLAAIGKLGQVKLAFDEWGLRMWHHPGYHDIPPVAVNGDEFKKNDDNAVYTMADAVFTARFLMSCLRHCGLVQMANYAPTVNTRGIIYTHPDGIVRRTNYHVFDLFVNDTGKTVLDAHVETPTFNVREPGLDFDIPVPMIDGVVTLDRENNSLTAAVTNLHPSDAVDVTLFLFNIPVKERAVIRTLAGDSTDAYNDVDRPDAVTFEETEGAASPNEVRVTLGPHSVSTITLTML